MKNSEVLNRTILECYVGSYIYGTNLPTSDMDEGGVCIPLRDHFLGVHKFEQANVWADENGNKIDKTIFAIDKAIELILNNNPNMIDYLYLPDRAFKKVTPEWKKILEIRDNCISKKCRYSYAGYAKAQIDRIKTHKEYLRKVVNKPLRSDFGLGESPSFPDHYNDVIAKLSTDYIPQEFKREFFAEMSSMIDNEAITIFRKYVEPNLVPIVMEEFKKGNDSFLGMISSISQEFLKEEYIGLAKKELAYMAAYKEYEQYKAWEKGRNPARKALEEKCGYDSKHGSHAIRLSRMSVEILDGKGVNVDRTGIDAEELVNIRLGNVPFQWVLEESQRLEEKAAELYKTSTLQNQPNRNLVHGVMMEVIEEYVFNNKAK